MGFAKLRNGSSAACSDAVDELLGLRLQPGLDGAEAAHDGVQQMGVGQPAWVTGQIDRDRACSIHAYPRRPPDLLSSQSVALNCFELDTSFGSFSYHRLPCIIDMLRPLPEFRARGEGVSGVFGRCTATLECTAKS